MKRVLFGFVFTITASLALASTAVAAESTHLHVLLAMDTDARASDGVSGIGTARDLEIWSSVIGEIQKNHADRVSLTIARGRDLTPDGILDFYRRLGQRPGWALLFVYSGHGATGTDGDHYLTMTHGGSLARGRLREVMEGTGSNLQVILTDCCGSIVPFEAVRRPIPAEWAMFEQLFFDAGGMVDVLSCEIGKLSFGNDDSGGMFTRACTRLLCSPISRSDGNGDGRVTWTEFFNQLRADTQQIASDASLRQVPTHWYLGGRQRFDQVLADTLSYARSAQTQLAALVAQASAAAGSGLRGYRQVLACSVAIARINTEAASRNARAGRLNVAAENARILDPRDTATTWAQLEQCSQIVARYGAELQRIQAWLRQASARGSSSCH